MGKSIPEKVEVNSYKMNATEYQVSGRILKMSQHWKKWEERFAEVISYQFNSHPFQVKEVEKKKEEKKKVKDKKG